MFSTIGRIFSNQPPRQAENTDTRQDIQRHDPDFERRRKKRQSEKEEPFPEDGATVSVEALRIFLENFLKSLSAQNTFNTGSKPKIQNHPQLDIFETQQSTTFRSAEKRFWSSDAGHRCLSTHSRSAAKKISSRSRKRRRSAPYYARSIRGPNYTYNP